MNRRLNSRAIDAGTPSHPTLFGCSSKTTARVIASKEYTSVNVCGCQRRCAQDLVQNRDGGQDDVGVLRMSYRERFRAVAAADVRPGSLPAATSILMAASSSSSRVMQCVYNVPMPQDLFYNTVGLDLNGALARNLKHFAESRLFTLGPMPVQR